MAGTLIDPSELRFRRDLVLIDARPGADVYARGHLPGACHADPERDLTGDASDPVHGGRHPLPDPVTFAQRLGAWGVRPARQVVIYDASTGADAAARLWWMLRSLGHAEVAVLDGGLAAARAAGMPLESSAADITTAAPYPLRTWTWPMASADDVEMRRSDPSWKVIDARSAERFAGIREPIDPVAGHIPGAVNRPYLENLDEDGRFRHAEELRSRYLALLGGVASDHVIVYCGSAMTACHTILALEHAGLPGASLYVGSFGEWCRQGRPVARSA